MITVTIRPNGARTEIRGLPWAGSRGAGYGIIEEAIGASRRGQVLFAGGAFSVARSHTKALIDALAAKYGRVHVVQHGGQTKCVSNCWQDADPETAWECECSCAGANHGTKQPLDRIVSDDGPAGSLSVTRAAVREYDVYGPGPR